MIERKKYFQQIDSVLKLKKSIFFTWSRQVGKTTLMKMYLEKKGIDYFYINFDEIFWYGIFDFKNIIEFLDYLNLFYKIDILKYDFIIFDEIVRVKNFNVILKALIDKYPNKTFFCSSSWEYEIVRNILEWLAWRIVKIDVFPLDFIEFLEFKWIKKNYYTNDKNFDLIKWYILEYLKFGSYPEVVLTNDEEWKKIVLKSIVDSIFQKDLLKLIKEEKILNFTYFTKLLRKNIWSLFSYEWFANKLWFKLSDIKKFIYALEKTQLLFLLNPFYTDKSKEITTKQKIYINDFWIYNFLENNFSSVELDGKYIEQFVFSQLKYNLWFFDKLFFYRKLNESEIDFIYENENWIIPIEVKSWNSDNIPKIFNSFCKVYKEKISYFVKTSCCLYKERLVDNCNVKILPYIDILEIKNNKCKQY